MIKKYLQFITEDLSDIEEQHHSLGEWVEDLCLENKEILELIKPYLEETNPSVRISNTVNVLDLAGKNSVYKIITDYLNGTGRKTDIRTFVNLTNESVTEDLSVGKNVFGTFLKVITSLGLTDIKPKWDNIPDNFLLFFEYESDQNTLSERLLRFPSLSYFVAKIPENNPKLYYGIKNDMTFSFGFIGEKLIQIGSFTMNKASLNYLQLLDSKAAAHLKRELAYINADKLKFIANIAKHMKLYHPGNTNNRSFKINDGLLEFGYQGLGSWSDGKLQDLATIKEGFRTHLQKLRGHENLRMRIDVSNDPAKAYYIWCVIEIK